MKVAEHNAPKSKQGFDLSAVVDNTESISELLVLNTNESPYLGTLSKTPAFVPPVSSKVVSKSLLEDAPSSIMKRDVLKREADEYMYAPGIGMVSDKNQINANIIVYVIILFSDEVLLIKLATLRLL